METVIRITLIYVVVLVGLHLLGKREFSQLSPLELVTLLLIPELVAQATVRDDFSLTNSLVALTTLFSLVFVSSVLIYKSRKVERVIEGTPAVLVAHGQLIAENLNKERVTPGEIFSEMHKAGLEHLSQVKWAVLEDDGKISIVPEDSADRAKRGKVEEKDMQ